MALSGEEIKLVTCHGISEEKCMTLVCKECRAYEWTKDRRLSRKRILNRLRVNGRTLEG